jgi:hypothetical protein
MSNKKQGNQNHVEKLFKLLLLTIVALKILNHFKFNYNMGPLMKGIEVLVLAVWTLLTLKDKHSQAEMKSMLIHSYNPFMHFA